MDSKKFNRTWRCKIGRTLYGWSGAVRLLGLERLLHITSKALRCNDDVYRYKVTSLGVSCCLYFK